MEMNEKTKAMICMELDLLKQKVEAGLISRFTCNTDRTFSVDGNNGTCTIINCLEEPLVENSDDRTDGLYEDSIPPSSLNKDTNTFRGVSSETICSDKYEKRKLPPFLEHLAGDPKNTKLLETILGIGLGGTGNRDNGALYFFTTDDQGMPIVETIVAPKTFMDDMKAKCLKDLTEQGTDYKASFPLVSLKEGEFPIGNTGFIAKRMPSEDKPSLKVVEQSPAFPTDLISDFPEF